MKGICFFDKNADATNNYAYFPILIEEEYTRTGDELYDFLKENNVYSRKYFYPLTSDQACFKNKYKKVPLDHARKISKEILILPLYEDLAMQDVEDISELIIQT